MNENQQPEFVAVHLELQRLLVSIQSVEQVRNQFIADPQQQQQIAMPPQQMDQQLMQQMMAAPQLVFQQPSANENLLQLFAHMIDGQK